MKIPKILLVEDRPEFSKVAKQVFESKNYEVTHAETYEDAVKALENQNYNFEFIFIDGFFPFSKKRFEFFENKELTAFAKEIINLSKETGKFKIDMDEYMGYLSGTEETPLGLHLAKRLEERGIYNYLITSAVNYHYKSYRILETYSKKKNLKLYLEDSSSPDATKSSPEFWEKALEMIEKNK